MWERLPTSWLEQPGSLQRPSGFSFVQCLESRSVLYRPESIRAAITAFPTSNGLPACVQRGCGRESDINPGLKYSREGRVSASALSFFSKKSVTKDLHLDFHWNLVGGDWRIIKGSGRQYFMHKCLTVRNQDDFVVDVLLADKRICLPCW